MKLALVTLSILFSLRTFAQTIKVQLTEDIRSRADGPEFFHATVIEEAFFSSHYFHVGADAIVTLRHPAKGLPYPALAMVVAGGDDVEFQDSASEPVNLLNAAGQIPSKEEQAKAISMLHAGNDFIIPSGTKLQFRNLQMDYGKYLKLKGQPLARTPEEWAAVKKAENQGTIATFKPSGAEDETAKTTEAAIARAHATTDPKAEICGPLPGIPRTCMDKASWIELDHGLQGAGQGSASNVSGRSSNIVDFHAVPVVPNDLSTFSFFSIRPDMSLEQARQALQSQGMDAKEYVASGTDGSDREINFNGNGFDLFLKFVKDGTGKMLLWQIEYGFWWQTNADLQSFYTRITTKFGTPTKASGCSTAPYPGGYSGQCSNEWHGAGSSISMIMDNDIAHFHINRTMPHEDKARIVIFLRDNGLKSRIDQFREDERKKAERERQQKVTNQTPF